MPTSTPPSTYIQSGLLASRPAAGNVNSYYYATDTQILYRDNGVAWTLVPSKEVGTILREGGGGGTDSIFTHGSYWIDTVGDWVRLTFTVPYDFNTLIDAFMVVIADANVGPLSIFLDSTYATDGEAGNFHTESDHTLSLSFVANQMTFVDTSTVLTGIAPRDVVTIQLTLRTAVTPQRLYCLYTGGLMRYI